MNRYEIVIESQDELLISDFSNLLQHIYYKLNPEHVMIGCEEWSLNMNKPTHPSRQNNIAQQVRENLRKNRDL